MSDFRYGVCGNGVFSLRDRHVFSASPRRSFYIKTIPALFAINHYLKQHGIRFIVVLVPDHNEIAVRALCPELRGLKSPVLQQELLAFEEAGIETISAWDEFSEAIPNGLLFCYGGDYHLEINGVKILARKTAEKLKNDIKPELTGDFSVNHENFLNRKWVFPIPCPIRKLNRGEKILTERIYYNGRHLLPSEAKDSILLICGNSFIGYPGFSAFSACLAKELRYIPYHLERQSTGLEKEIPRLLLTDPSILDGRKICIMVIDSTRVANGQWLNIRDLDQKLTKFDGAVLVAELKATDFAAPLDSVAIPEWDISTLAKAKQSHRRHYHYFKIQKSGKSRSLDIKLPESVSKTGKYIAAIPMWSNSLSKLKVADSEEALFSGEEILSVPIPSADTINLNFNSAFSAALMGIGDIKIYKLKEH